VKGPAIGVPVAWAVWRDTKKTAQINGPLFDNCLSVVGANGLEPPTFAL